MLNKILRGAAAFAAPPQELVYVGGQIASLASGTTSTVNFSLIGGTDSTPQPGDLVVILYAAASSTTPVANNGPTTSGYSRIRVQTASNTRAVMSSLSVKLMGATADASVAFPSSGGTANAHTAIIHVWRNVDPDFPYYALSSNVTASTAIPDPPPATGSFPNTVLLFGGAGGHTAATNTYTAATGLENFRANSGFNTTNDAAAGLGSKSGQNGLSYDPVAFTFGGTDSTGNSAVGFALGLKPGPAVSGYPVITGSSTAGNTTSLALARPASAVAGDLLVAIIASSSNGDVTVFGGPSGWTRVGDTGASSTRGILWKKVVTGSEPSSYTFSVSSASGGTNAGVLFAISGADSSGVAISDSLTTDYSPPSKGLMLIGSLAYGASATNVFTRDNTFTRSGFRTMGTSGAIAAFSKKVNGPCAIGAATIETSGGTLFSFSMFVPAS